jgi:hypothetical protein
MISSPRASPARRRSPRARAAASAPHLLVSCTWRLDDLTLATIRWRRPGNLDPALSLACDQREIIQPPGAGYQQVRPMKVEDRARILRAIAAGLLHLAAG